MKLRVVRFDRNASLTSASRARLSSSESAWLGAYSAFARGLLDPSKASLHPVLFDTAEGAARRFILGDDASPDQPILRSMVGLPGSRGGDPGPRDLFVMVPAPSVADAFLGGDPAGDAAIALAIDLGEHVAAQAEAVPGLGEDPRVSAVCVRAAAAALAAAALWARARAPGSGLPRLSEAWPRRAATALLGDLGRRLSEVFGGDADNRLRRAAVAAGVASVAAAEASVAAAFASVGAEIATGDADPDALASALQAAEGAAHGDRAVDPDDLHDATSAVLAAAAAPFLAVSPRAGR